MMLTAFFLLAQVTTGASSVPTPAEQAERLLATLRGDGRDARLLRVAGAFTPVAPFEDMALAVTMGAGVRAMAAKDGSPIRQVVFSIREVARATMVDIDQIKAAVGDPDAISEETRGDQAAPSRDAVYWWGALGLGVSDRSSRWATWLYVKLPIAEKEQAVAHSPSSVAASTTQKIRLQPSTPPVYSVQKRRVEGAKPSTLYICVKDNDIEHLGPDGIQATATLNVFFVSIADNNLGAGKPPTDLELLNRAIPTFANATGMSVTITEPSFTVIGPIRLLPELAQQVLEYLKAPIVGFVSFDSAEGTYRFLESVEVRTAQGGTRKASVTEFAKKPPR